MLHSNDSFLSPIYIWDLPLSLVLCQILDQLHNVSLLSSVRGNVRFLFFFSTLKLFVSPTHLIVTIAATRVHRALVDFPSGSSDVYDTLTSFSSSLSRLVRPLPF